jgi:hypothetical protein
MWSVPDLYPTVIVEQTVKFYVSAEPVLNQEEA